MHVHTTTSLARRFLASPALRPLCALPVWRRRWTLPPHTYGKDVMNERPNVGGVSTRSRNGAPSRKGCMRGQWSNDLRQATNEYALPYGHTTTAIHENEQFPPPPPYPFSFCFLAISSACCFLGFLFLVFVVLSQILLLTHFPGFFLFSSLISSFEIFFSSSWLLSLMV
ncbi:unnamed protein product [Laminaria digitata]